MKIEDIYKLYSESYLIDTDTRKIRKNAIYVALKGEKFDGNKFAKNAILNGAKYAIIDNVNYAKSKKFILVKNTLETLQELANFHRRILNIPIISLTGSNGKTTTKELINTILSKRYSTTATQGNLNNHIGVPLTLLSMTPKTEIGIVEMGANHQKEISFLSTIAEPNYGYITNFGKAHLEGFGGVQGVIKGKSELYDYLRKSNGTAFINKEDEIQVEKSTGIKKINLSSNVQFDTANPFVSFYYKDEKVTSKLIGAYNYFNILAAITIGEHFKVSNTDIIKAIENYTPTNNRSQIISKNNSTIILDAYNANPSSMKVALDNLDKINSDSKIVILGDMFELGEVAEVEHQNIINRLEKFKLDKAIVIGDNFNKCKTNTVFKYKNIEDFKTYSDIDIYKKSTILIKGSRGMALERVLDLFQ